MEVTPVAMGRPAGSGCNRTIVDTDMWKTMPRPTDDQINKCCLLFDGSLTDPCFVPSPKTMSPYNGLPYRKFSFKLAAQETADFALAWLSSRIIIQNFFEWFMPRLLGFICARGLYPMVVCDFFYDLCFVQCAESASQGTDKDLNDTGFIGDEQGCSGTGCGACCGCKVDDVSTRRFENRHIPDNLIQSCEMQSDRQTYFKVIDNTNELAVQFLYCNMFVMPYPGAPFLFLLNTIIEFNADLLRLFDRRRPIPTASAGLADIWATIFDAIIYMSVIMNVMWCSYHTSVPKFFLGEDSPIKRIVFFVITTFSIIVILMMLQICIKDEPDDVEDHLARQRKVELRLVSRAIKKDYIELSNAQTGYGNNIRQLQNEEG